VEASALHQAGLTGVAGKSPLLRLRSDEQLIAMTRRGNQAAFEMLVQRYQPRLLAFCRHMLGSKEDAEDVLQEVFAASYNALLADDRPINTRPWLYRIARNRSLNHLRKPRNSGQDSMDIFERDNGTSTADTVHRREEFRQIVADVGQLPETQRTALLLREIDALSYDQIAEAMDTTVPSVKSLLVRARVSLAEASEARLLTCAEVRLELGEVAEGLTKTTAPVRRHLKTCKQCRVFRGELRSTTRALAAVYPIGPLIALKLGFAKLGFGGAAAGGTAATAGSGAAAGGATVAASSAVVGASSAMTAGGAISAVTGTLAGKAAAGMAAAAIVTAGAAEVKHVVKPSAPPASQVSAVSTHPAPPAAAAKVSEKPTKAAAVEAVEAPTEPTPPAAVPVPAPPTQPAPVPATPPVAPPVVQEDEGTVTLPADPVPTTTPEETSTTPAPPPEPPPPTATTPIPPPPPAPPAAGGSTTTPKPPPPPPGS
jgi:RNA polymerase sigma factor (sigma-70 family)